MVSGSKEPRAPTTSASKDTASMFLFCVLHSARGAYFLSISALAASIASGDHSKGIVTTFGFVCADDVQIEGRTGHLLLHEAVAS